MKHIITSLLLTVSGTVMASNNGANMVPSRSAVAEINATAAITKLQLENKLLLEKLASMQELQEETLSQVNYQSLMHKVIFNANDLRQQEIMQEMDARMNFERTMTSVLKTLPHSAN